MVKYYTKAKIIQPVSTRMVIKKIIVYIKKKKPKWANNSFISFKKFKGWKGNYCLSIKTIPD